MTLLVDERSTEIWNKLTSLSKTKTYVSQEMIDEWIAKRLVFPLSGQGMTLLYQHEKSVQQQHFQAMVTKAPPFKSNSKFVDLRSFVNYGTEK